EVQLVLAQPPEHRVSGHADAIRLGPKFAAHFRERQADPERRVRRAAVGAGIAAGHDATASGARSAARSAHRGPAAINSARLIGGRVIAGASSPRIAAMADVRAW